MTRNDSILDAGLWFLSDTCYVSSQKYIGSLHTHVIFDQHLKSTCYTYIFDHTSKVNVYDTGSILLYLKWIGFL